MSRDSNIITDFSKNLEPGSTAAPSGFAIQSTLNDELKKWEGKTERGNRELLEPYWRHAGWADDEWTPESQPWSAVWVTYQIRDLPPSAAHWSYVRAVINGDVPGWRAYRIDEGTQLNEGDIIVKPRGWAREEEAEYWFSHGDIVHSVAGDSVAIVGGNVGQTVKIASIPRSGKDPYIIVLKKKKSPTPKMALLLAVLAGLAYFATKRG